MNTLKNEVIREEIRRVTSMPKAARAIGCSTKSLYNKIEGTRPWKITDVIALSRLCNWTVAEFLDIIEYEEVWK